MSRANIHDRSTIERLYPRDAYEQDAGRNSEAKAQVLHGLRILSAPDAQGDFELARASRQIAEDNPEGDAVFVVPYLRESYGALVETADYGGPHETGDALAEIEGQGEDYDAFVDRVVATARSADFKPPIGLHAKRLRGFHGG